MHRARRHSAVRPGYGQCRNTATFVFSPCNKDSDYAFPLKYKRLRWLYLWLCRAAEIVDRRNLYAHVMVFMAFDSV